MLSQITSNIATNLDTCMSQLPLLIYMADIVLMLAWIATVTPRALEGGYAKQNKRWSSTPVMKSIDTSSEY